VEIRHSSPTICLKVMPLADSIIFKHVSQYLSTTLSLDLNVLKDLAYPQIDVFACLHMSWLSVLSYSGVSACSYIRIIARSSSCRNVVL